MNKRNFRIVFMGTPDFASGILQKLLHREFNIVGVVTMPDKPAGRGQITQESSVKKLAREHGITTWQPANLKDESFIETLKEVSADLYVVVAFRMLPEVVWSIPPNGTINLHASLLPQYRGAAPINRAIMNGEKTTGVTTFFIEKEIDTGKIIEQTQVEIGEDMNAGQLHDLLMEKGAELVCSTVEKIISNEINPLDQIQFQEVILKVAPKIFKEDCRITFEKTAMETHNIIRGLSPYPAAWCQLITTDGQKKQFKLFGSKITSIPSQMDQTLHHHPEGILFPCSDYYILITSLQPEGKRRMTFKEFLAGNIIEGAKINV